MSPHTANRKTLLAAHGLAAAAPWQQRAFWRAWNRPRAKWAALADLAGEQWSTRLEPLAGQMARLEQAWQEVLPEGFGRRASIHSFDAGVLMVDVDSPATRYVLQRQLETTIRQGLNEALGRSTVKRISFRLGAGDRPSPHRA